MEMHQKFLFVYRNHLAFRHAFSLTNYAVLCMIACEKDREWKPRDFTENPGLSYVGAVAVLKRLRLEGMIDMKGRITSEGMNCAGIGFNQPSEATEQLF